MLKLLIIINLFLLSGQLVLSFTRSTQGIDLGNLQRQTENLQTENQRLRQEIYNHSSLSYIKSQSVSLVPIKTSFYTPPPVAQAGRP